LKLLSGQRLITMITNKGNLTELQYDALKEVANIGSGRAASTLSRLLNRKIMIRVPKLLTGTVDSVISTLPDSNSTIVSIMMNFLGDITGKAFLLFPYRDAKRLIDLLVDDTIQQVTEVRESVLKEVTNILFCSYINALGEWLGFIILPSVPGMHVDMVDAVSSMISRESSGLDDFLLGFETEFSFREEQTTLHAYLLIMPDTLSLESILRALQLTR
jgi:chemotaxis protein CheC